MAQNRKNDIRTRKKSKCIKSGWSQANFQGSFLFQWLSGMTIFASLQELRFKVLIGVQRLKCICSFCIEFCAKLIEPYNIEMVNLKRTREYAKCRFFGGGRKCSLPWLRIAIKFAANRKASAMHLRQRWGLWCLYEFNSLHTQAVTNYFFSPWLAELIHKTSCQ